jgi:hypothetical protein
MRFGRKSAALAAALILGSATAASAQVPNFLQWLIPGQKSQPANGGSQGNSGGRDCSTDPRPSAYFNDCGEYIPGQNDSPVHG